MACGKLAFGPRVEDQDIRLRRGGKEGPPVDQPGRAIAPHLLGEPRIGRIVDLRIGRLRGGERRSGGEGKRKDTGTEHGTVSFQGGDRVVTALELSSF